MIHRVYTERKDTPSPEALSEIKGIKGCEGISSLRVLNRYDVQGLTDAQMETCKASIFAEPFTDNIILSLPHADYTLAVEYLPGQFDQRANAAEQCAGLLLGFRPAVKTAKVYLIYGEDVNMSAVKKHLINPVEAREATLEEYSTLTADYPVPDDVAVVDDVMSVKGLAMSREDLACVKDYFDSEGRKPTVAEIKVLDTYWSDHCRHTTFNTVIDDAEIHDDAVRNAYEIYRHIRRKLGRDNTPVTLMDIATIGAKYLNHPDVVHSEENNACTVRIDVDGESWLLLFKNETHNHPTEIEPFGGAATCIGGAIRDPLSGRAYVYQAMRITGAASPFTSTLPGKLPQKTIITKSAEGYSSYGNQIGIPTGIVREIYHEGYRAKRLEIGAVIGAVKESNVIREAPEAGDVVLLLGGRTGRDGIGGATGSSVSHNAQSLDTCGAEVQKGNAPEERKLQRLFRNPEFTRLIKRCNDFGAGGVSVAVGELADGLDINLDAVPLKYSGLDGTEIAVSESQERMAVVVDRNNADRIIQLASCEDVEATIIATVNDTGRMRMTWRGEIIADISRAFINTNGARRKISLTVNSRQQKISQSAKFPDMLADLNQCSQRGLAERFDSTVGGNTVLMPFGGKFQKTPIMAMCAKIPCEHDTDTCSLMSYGFVIDDSPFYGAYFSVLEALCKVIASGGNLNHCWLTLQEYFPKPDDSIRWGLPFSALLGALKAQIDYGVGAIGGKDSMSGTFTHDGERLDVPPALVAFAVSVSKTDNIISPEFKKPGNRVILLKPDTDSHGLPIPESMRAILHDAEAMIERGEILSCSVADGDIRPEIFRMCLGNNLGYAGESSTGLCFIAEIADDVVTAYPVIGHVTIETAVTFDGVTVSLADAEAVYDAPLSEIFPVSTNEPPIPLPLAPVHYPLPTTRYPLPTTHSPLFLIPVFAGTNCEYETARAITRAGGRAEIIVIRSLTPDTMRQSADDFAKALKHSQSLVIPGGFSNSDEPDGSGKFIAIFLRSPQVREALENLIDDGGLVCGICNGFQALVKTGLLPHGRFTDSDLLTSTLTFNRIGRHQSRIIRSVVTCSNSPWMKFTKPGEIYSMPVSHGEGRFLCSAEEFSRLMKSGQVAARYCDYEGRPSMLTEHNPSGSFGAVECLTSCDGRIIGRMGHLERNGLNLSRNVAGNYSLRFFEAACYYFNHS